MRGKEEERERGKEEKEQEKGRKREGKWESKACFLYKCTRRFLICAVVMFRGYKK